ncbi:MAG: beta-carotene 15,15-monooxygenase [Frankiales bacterium]|nr:beta-carotene 15,15-monooxygenase [Frankiales bacterium]
MPAVDLSPARPYAAAVAVAAVSAVLTVTGAAVLGLPIRDPDGVAGPSWIRLPGIVLVFLALDVVPRALLARREAGGLRAAYREVVATRWTRERLALVGVGLGSFYVSYVAYRNLKGFLPFARDGVDDTWLLTLDRVFLLGHDPSAVLHTLLGTGVSAHVLSFVYVAFLFFVPLSLGASLVWSRDATRGAWYVTALTSCWTLGALSYYLVPSLGPVYARPRMFKDLPVTSVTHLQESLLANRVEVLTDPWATQALHGIGAFASLHVAVVLTAALIVQRMGLSPVLRVTMWVYFVLTVLSTIYFGWHYVLDDIAGAGIGWVSVWFAGRATGQDHASREEHPAPVAVSV